MPNTGPAPNDGPELRLLGGADNLGGLIAPNTNGGLFVVEVDVELKAEPLPNGAGTVVAVGGVELKLVGLGNGFVAKDDINGLAELVVVEVGAADDPPNGFEITPVLVGNVGANELSPNPNAGCDVDDGITAVVVDVDDNEVLLGIPKDNTAGTLDDVVETVDVTTGVVVALELAVDIEAKG